MTDTVSCIVLAMELRSASQSQVAGVSNATAPRGALLVDLPSSPEQAFAVELGSLAGRALAAHLGLGTTTSGGEASVGCRTVALLARAPAGVRDALDEALEAAGVDADSDADESTHAGASETEQSVSSAGFLYEEIWTKLRLARAGLQPVGSVGMELSAGSAMSQDSMHEVS